MSKPTSENLSNALDEFLKHPNAATCWSLFCLAQKLPDDPLSSAVNIVRKYSYKKTFPQIKSLMLETLNEVVNIFERELEKRKEEESVNERKS